MKKILFFLAVGFIGLQLNARDLSEDLCGDNTFVAVYDESIELEHWASQFTATQLYELKSNGELKCRLEDLASKLSVLESKFPGITKSGHLPVISLVTHTTQDCDLTYLLTVSLCDTWNPYCCPRTQQYYNCLDTAFNNWIICLATAEDPS